MADKETVIGPETRISGDIRGEEDLVVRGRVEGKVSLTQTLTVEAGGIVQADVEVKTLIVTGVLVGNIVASESVRLTDKARVIGDITSPRVLMESGAAFRGRIDMGEGEAARPAKKAPAATARPAPPRMTTPPRVVVPAATSAIRAPGPPSPPPRVTTAPARPASPPPPSLPRADGAVATAGIPSAMPNWAKKKILKRK